MDITSLPAQERKKRLHRKPQLDDWAACSQEYLVRALLFYCMEAARRLCVSVEEMAFSLANGIEIAAQEPGKVHPLLQPLTAVLQWLNDNNDAQDLQDRLAALTSFAEAKLPFALPSSVTAAAVMARHVHSAAAVVYLPTEEEALPLLEYVRRGDEARAVKWWKSLQAAKESRANKAGASTDVHQLAARFPLAALQQCLMRLPNEVLRSACVELLLDGEGVRCSWRDKCSCARFNAEDFANAVPFVPPLHGFGVTEMYRVFGDPRLSASSSLEAAAHPIVIFQE